MQYIKTMCLRCGDPYMLEAGLNLADFCPTCRKYTGRRMFEFRQRQMNSNWAFQRDVLKVSADGGPLPKPLVFVKGKS